MKGVGVWITSLCRGWKVGYSLIKWDEVENSRARGEILYFYFAVFIEFPFSLCPRRSHHAAFRV